MRSFLFAIGILLCSQLTGLAQKMETFPLKVGAAKVDMTPPGEPTSPATGKYDHERSYARVIVINNGTTSAALISLEGSTMDELTWTNLYKLVTAELNCPVENIIIAMSHSHSVKKLVRNSEASSENSSLSNPEDIIMGAVREAKSKLQPALMGFGRGMSYLNVNRDVIDEDSRKWTQAANIDGWSDKSVDVIKFETPEGKPIAVYMNYAIHPVNAYVLNVFSGDIPGAVCRYVEKAFNDEIIVAFSQGSVGDQNPLHLRLSTNAMASRAGVPITGYELNREHTEASLRIVSNAGQSSQPPKTVDSKLLHDLFRFIESEGQILGEEVIRIMTSTTKMTGDVNISGQERVFTCPGRRRTDGDYLGANREGVPGTYEDGPDVKIRLGALGLGNTVILRADGELFSYIGMKIKSESPLKNTMVVSFANLGRDRGFYIPYDAAFGEQTFQVLNTPLKPGCAESSIINGFVEMVTDYLDK